jgi:hypothetical protein
MTYREGLITEICMVIITVFIVLAYFNGWGG